MESTQNNWRAAAGLGALAGIGFGLMPAALAHNTLLKSGGMLQAMKGAVVAGAIGGGMVGVPAAAFTLLAGKSDPKQAALQNLHDAVRHKQPSRFKQALIGATLLGGGAGYLTLSWVAGYASAIGLKPMGALKIGGFMAAGMGAFGGLGGLLSSSKPADVEAARDHALKAIDTKNIMQALSEFYQTVPASEQGAKKPVFELFEVKRTV